MTRKRFTEIAGLMRLACPMIETVWVSHSKKLDTRHRDGFAQMLEQTERELGCISQWSCIEKDFDFNGSGVFNYGGIAHEYQHFDGRTVTVYEVHKWKKTGRNTVVRGESVAWSFVWNK